MKLALAHTLLLLLVGACATGESARAPAPRPAPRDDARPAEVADETRALARERELVDAARAAVESGDLVEARALAKEAIDLLLARPEPESDADWLELLNAAGRTAWLAKDAAAARAACERVLAVRSRTLPEDHRDLQDARANLALALQSLGELPAAQALLEKALASNERVLAPDDPALQTTRLRLAAVLQARGDLAGAARLQEPALAVLEQTLPEDDPKLRSARLDFAQALIFSGRAAEGRVLAEKVIEVSSSAGQKDMRALSLLCSALFNLGDREGARAVAEEWLAVAEAAVPPQPDAVLRAKLNLGLALRALDRLDEARPLVEEVVAAWEKSRSEDSMDLQQARLILGTCYLVGGELLKARELFERVLAAYERLLPKDNPNVQMARSNLALTLRHLGDDEGARPLFERAAASFERTRGPDDLDLQRVRLNLATVRKNLGDLEGARDLGRRVLESYLRVLPENSPDVLMARGNLANSLQALGDTEAARAMLEECLAGWEQLVPEESLGLQQVRINLAVTLRIAGELEPARELLERALTHMEHVLPPENDAVRQAQASLAMTLAGLDRPRETAELLEKMVSSSRVALEAARLESPPREADARAEAEHAWISALLSLEGWVRERGADARLSTEVFELCETARCLGLQGELWARSLASPEREAELEELRSEVRRRSAVLARLSAEQDEEAFVAALREKEAAQRRLRELAGRSPADRPELPRMDLEALRRRLGPDEALLAYWVYSRIEPVPKSADQLAGSPNLTAFVVTRDRGLERVELGELAPIRESVDTWRAGRDAAAGRGVAIPGVAAASSEAETGAALQRLLLDRLPPGVRDARTWIVVADGPAHLVPFDALPLEPDPSDHRVLGDEHRIEMRSTTWELLLAPSPSNASPALLGVGGVDFDVEAGAANTAKDGDAVRGSLGHFDALPATAREASEIGALFRSSAGPQARVEELSGGEATAARVVAQASTARFLHFATHGFTAPESLPSGGDARLERARRGLAPMALCGLALAGANRDGEGILTAEELAGLDLSGCELAVLSACETGLGIERAGLGIASLQKAMQIAGARSVITSLWKVPDEATRELMLDFYRRIWIEKESKSTALWKAKRSLRDRGAPTRDWAAWVLTGDPD